MKAIAALNNLNYIGKDGKLMWKCKEDFKHFKRMTMGGICIVGSNTFDGDFAGSSTFLKGRTLVPVGKKYNTLEQAVRQAFLEQAYINDLRVKSDPHQALIDIWVIGGQMIYEQLMPMISEFHISRINDNQVGDRKLVIPNSYRGKIIDYHFEPDKPQE